MSLPNLGNVPTTIDLTEGLEQSAKLACALLDANIITHEAYRSGDSPSAFITKALQERLDTRQTQRLEFYAQIIQGEEEGLYYLLLHLETSFCFHAAPLLKRLDNFDPQLSPYLIAVLEDTS